MSATERRDAADDAAAGGGAPAGGAGGAAMGTGGAATDGAATGGAARRGVASGWLRARDGKAAGTAGAAWTAAGTEPRREVSRRVAPRRAAPQRAVDPASDPATRMGGVALKNGLVLLTERNWAAAIREADGTISVASGKKPRLPGSGGPGAPESTSGAGAGTSTRKRAGAGAGTSTRKGVGAAGSPGIPLVRGLGRFGESLMVLGLVKMKLPNAVLPLEGGRVAAALAASMAGTSAVRAAAPKSALAQEAGTALAAFIPAVLALKNSEISGYHGAEHKVIGAREARLRAAAQSDLAARAGSATEKGAAASGGAAAAAGPAPVAGGDSADAAKEHDRCGSNLVGPYLIATVLTNWLARGRSGQKTPAGTAAAGAASLGLALEALRWTTKHKDSALAKLMLLPGRTIQKRLTTSEPTPEQLEVGERALAELLRLEGATV